MKHLYFLIFLLSSQLSFCQDVLIKNQKQLDGLAPPISVTGNLSIISDGSGDIYDLSKLRSLTTITGTLIIKNNPILSNLDSLSSLTTISGGKIIIENNANLYSFCGLRNVSGPISDTIRSNSYNPTYADIVGAKCKAPDFIYNDTAKDRFNTQAEIDALPDGITHITDELVIGLTAATNDITNLSKFSKLRDIGGRLLIQFSPQLKDLTGLKAVEVIGSAAPSSQELVIREMGALENLNGLQALRKVGRRIGIRSNPKLLSLYGLDNLQSISQNMITIGGTVGQGNPLLEDFCALRGIIGKIGTQVLEADPLSYINNETSFNPSFTDISKGKCTSVYTGDLTVATQASIDTLPIQYTRITGKLDIVGANGNINDLSKFSKLRDIGGRLLIQDCPLLKDLTGLSSLKIVGSGSSQELAIRRMAGLTTLNGLQALTTVSRRIGVWANPVLTTLNGLNNLKNIGDNVATGTNGLIRIGNGPSTPGENPMLKDFCALQGIVNIITPAVLDADKPNSYINGNGGAFAPTFQQFSNGPCAILPSAVEEIAKGSYSIYPNPSSNLLTVKSDEILESIRIMNYLGMEMLKTNETVIDISNLAAGFYFIEIKAGNKQAVDKIVKN